MNLFVSITAYIEVSWLIFLFIYFSYNFAIDREWF